MKEYITIQLENNQEFVIIDSIDYYNKKYFFATELIGKKVVLDNSFKVYIYDEQKTLLKTIESEEEYNFIFSIFESRLKEKTKIDELIEEMIKTKIVSTDGFNYTLETITGHTLTKNIEFHIPNKPKINDYIYMSKDILNEINIFQYGKLYDLNKINKNEIIIIETKNNEFMLQRYYG